jgi:Protein of unknown function with HXXEE motif
MKSKPLLILAGAAGALAIALFRKRTAVKPTQALAALPSALRNVDRTIAIPTAMTLGSIAVWSRVSHGNTLRYTFVPTMALSWALYMLYLRKNMPDPEKITSFYLFALAWQLVHFVEENSTGFRYRWPIEIFGTKPYGSRQYVAINALSYAIFIAGAVALLNRRPEFSMPAIFFAVMGVMFNGIQHPIYSMMVKGYFPGLFTGLVDLAIGPFLLKRLFSRATTSAGVVSLPAAA